MVRWCDRLPEGGGGWGVSVGRNQCLRLCEATERPSLMSPWTENPSCGFEKVRVCRRLDACECVFTSDCACLCAYLFLWAYTYIPPRRLLTEGDRSDRLSKKRASCAEYANISGEDSISYWHFLRFPFLLLPNIWRVNESQHGKLV